MINATPVARSGPVVTSADQPDRRTFLTQNAKQRVVDASDYETKVDELHRAEFAVEQLLRQLSETPALTPLRITIKAEAYQACAATGKEERSQASPHLGPSIADDVCESCPGETRHERASRLDGL